MPLGLTCGHKFCTECILHAVGSQCFCGPTSPLLRCTHVTTSDTTRPAALTAVQPFCQVSSCMPD